MNTAKCGIHHEDDCWCGNSELEQLKIDLQEVEKYITDPSGCFVDLLAKYGLESCGV